MRRLEIGAEVGDVDRVTHGLSVRLLGVRQQGHILSNVERANRLCNMRARNGEYRGLGVALAAPMEHVKGHGHVHAVVTKWLWQ